MAHSHVSNRVHCIFSTKNRVALLGDELQPRVWAYMGGICRHVGVPVLAIGGFTDHAHVFVALPPTLCLSEFMQKLKANSSRWIREQIGKTFAWQDSYGAFSVGISQTAATIRYIETQPEHHRKRSFDDEIRGILARHGMTYKPE